MDINYGFAGAAYLGLFLCDFLIFLSIIAVINDGLNQNNKEDEAFMGFFSVVKVLTTLTAISLVVGVAQWPIEKI